MPALFFIFRRLTIPFTTFGINQEKNKYEKYKKCTRIAILRNSPIAKCI
jgi:hypothetical protein